MAVPLTAKARRTEVPGHLSSWLTSTRAWSLLCIVWAAIIAASHLYEMDPDGFSYLQMAAKAADGDLSALANSYWSPGYPAMLALILAIFRPTPEGAFAAAHALNFLIFVAAIAAFVYFLKGWSRLTCSDGMGRPILAADPLSSGSEPAKSLLRAELPTQQLLVPLGFVLFLKFGIDWLGVHSCTPDLAVGAIVLLAAGILCRAVTASSPYAFMALLGIVLAAGYYIKAVLFPLGIILLLLLFLLPPSLSRRAVLLAAVMFALVSAPFIAVQSRKAGRLSFGESGRLNYAWFVDDIAPVQHGTPPDPAVHFFHPPRRISQHPVTLEFAQPVEACYPLWYDPYYWTGGIQTYFNLKKQIAAIKAVLLRYADMAMQLSVVIAASIVLIASTSLRARLFDRRAAWVLLWPLSAFTLYCLVHTELRFLGGFMILLWMGVLSAGLRGSQILARGAIVAIVGVTLLFPASFRLVLATGRLVSSVLRPAPTIDAVAARALHAMGLHDGDAILVVGETFEPYYAWVGKLKVVAQVPDQDELWRLSTADFNDWLGKASSSGARALVAMDRPQYANQVRWYDLPASSHRSSTIGGASVHRYSIYVLKRAS